MKENLTTLRGELVGHGATAQRLALPLLALMTRKVFPFRVASSPMVPVTLPNCWLRRADPPSYWSTVTLIRVWAGRSHNVVWTHCPLGVWVRYDTQEGWGPKPIEPTVCTVRSTGAPDW